MPVVAESPRQKFIQQPRKPLVKSIPPTRHKKVWTYTDYLTLDDEHRYEIIEGGLTVAPAPNFNHQESSSDLHAQLWHYIRQHHLGRVIAAPLDVILADDTVVQPDIVFIAAENAGIIVPEGVRGAPNLVIEILSPTSLQRDRHEKFSLYEKFGIPEYWLVDPANHSIEVFNLSEGKYRLTCMAAEKGQIKSQAIAGLKLRVEKALPKKK